MIYKVVRQGDVVVIPVELLRETTDDNFVTYVNTVLDELEKGSTKSTTVVIRGENHVHELIGSYKAKLIGEDMYAVVVMEEAELKHAEHGNVKIGKGRYLVMRIVDAVRRGDSFVATSSLSGNMFLTRAFD